MELENDGAYRENRAGQVRTTDRSHPYWRHPNLLKHTEPKYPDHVWVADITYIRLGWHLIYLAVILDAYTRAGQGWALHPAVEKLDTLWAGHRGGIVRADAVSGTEAVICWHDFHTTPRPIIWGRTLLIRFYRTKPARSPIIR